MVRDLGFVVVLALSLTSLTTCGGSATTTARPQVSVESLGNRYAPLPPRASVKVYMTGEPDESYREIGRVSASCPMKHWVRGQEQSGRPVCMTGLKQGARMLGGQAVVEVRVQRTRPPWEPDRPWFVMRAVVIRLVH